MHHMKTNKVFEGKRAFVMNDMMLPMFGACVPFACMNTDVHLLFRFVMPNSTDAKDCNVDVSVAIPTVASVIRIEGASHVRVEGLQFKFTARTILER